MSRTRSLGLRRGLVLHVRLKGNFGDGNDSGV